MQRVLSRSQSHVWFERFEMRDRMIVTNRYETSKFFLNTIDVIKQFTNVVSFISRLKEHVEDHSLDPMLIFPEGYIIAICYIYCKPII